MISGPTVGMWRDPVKRFESTYRWWRLRRAYNAHKLDFVSWGLWALDWDFPCDPHLMLQADSGNMTGIRVAWDFVKMAELLGIKEISSHNQSPTEIKTVWTPTLTRDFSDAYARDLEIWETINEHQAEL